MTKLQDAAIRIAVGEIGKQEIPKGSNWGVNVIKYLASVGIHFPASWCIAFIYWCYSEAGRQLSLPSIPLYRSGGCLEVLRHTPKILIVTNPQPGDIGIQDHGGGLGHAFLIERREGDELITVEGNTNNDGSREGYEVERKRRDKNDPKTVAYIRVE